LDLPDDAGSPDQLINEWTGAIPPNELMELLRLAHSRLPGVLDLYAGARSVQSEFRAVDDLARLREGVRVMLYAGVELAVAEHLYVVDAGSGPRCGSG
jgi:hypothetical protein